MGRPGSRYNPDVTYYFSPPLVETIRLARKSLDIRSTRYFMQAAFQRELETRWMDDCADPLPPEYREELEGLRSLHERLRREIWYAARRRAYSLGLSFAEYARRVAYRTATAGLLDGEVVINGVVEIGGDRWQLRGAPYGAPT